MRTRLLATAVALSSAAFTFVPVVHADERADAVAKQLAEADPLAALSKRLAETASDAGFETAVRALAKSESADAVVRDRALRLTLAFDLADRVQEGRAKPALRFWMALDELDRHYLSGPREALLARAVADRAERGAALVSLAAGRDTARRFVLEWGTISDIDGPVAERHAELDAALKKAGLAAAPALLEMLAVPPEGTFTVMHVDRGTTALMQVHALFALDLLNITSAAPYLVFQTHGPSFTESNTALDLLGKLCGVEFPASGDGDSVGTAEDARNVALNSWWVKNRERHVEMLDHLVRSVLRWTRAAVKGPDADRHYWAGLGMARLRRLLGRSLDFDPDAEPDAQAAQVAAIERSWLAGGLR